MIKKIELKKGINPSKTFVWMSQAREILQLIVRVLFYRRVPVTNK